jgi:hypothetical protein
MKLRTLALVGLVVAVVCGVVYFATRTGPTADDDIWTSTDKPAPPAKAVALSQTSDVPEGFRGAVHPNLYGPTLMEVSARWSEVGHGRDQMHAKLSPKLYSVIKELQPAEARRTYTASDFSAFMPKGIGEVGQIWSLDGDKIVRILTQFHPHPSLKLVASGRRAGPDGAFGILRGVSSEYLDIAFRIHAEFELTLPQWSSNRPQVRAWYTPAYFSGHMLVHQRTGTVDDFRLALAADKALNVHLTVEFKDVGLNRQGHDIVRVEQMELTGGDPDVARKIVWTKELTVEEADRRLAKVFYKFHDIDWLPFDQVAEQARKRQRPIFAIVSWGSFDDQSC